MGGMFAPVSSGQVHFDVYESKKMGLCSGRSRPVRSISMFSNQNKWGYVRTGQVRLGPYRCLPIKINGGYVRAGQLGSGPFRCLRIKKNGAMFGPVRSCQVHIDV